MKSLFFILFASSAIFQSSTKATDPSINYDITTLLNNSIAKTFENSDRNLIENSILNTEDDDTTNYDKGFHYTYDYIPFQNEYYFSNVNITIFSLEYVHVRRAFSNYKLNIFIPKLAIEVIGHLEATYTSVPASFAYLVEFQNTSVIAFKQPAGLPKFKLFIQVEHKECFNIYSRRFKQNTVNAETQFQIEQKIDEIMPSLFLDYLQRNKKFLRSLDATYCNHPETEITSRYPDFKLKPDQYYFFVPNFTSLQRTLSNITISGLWNFHSYSFGINLGQSETTLTIENIRGRASLYYGPQNSTVFPLSFKAGSISISVDEEKQRVSVTANNYSVSQTTLNGSLTAHQQNWVMEGIELAIASSIMPSIKAYRNRSKSSNTPEKPLMAKILSTMSRELHGSDSIEKVYRDCNMSMLENITVESNLQFESSNYNISVFSVPLERKNRTILYPDGIVCELYNNLKVTFNVASSSWPILAAISISNSTHQLGKIHVIIKTHHEKLVKRNNSKENNDFEWDTGPDIDIIMLTASVKYNFTENQTDAIIQKAKEMFNSTFSETFMFLAKRLTSLPLFDYCTAPVNMFDDFLPFYAEYEVAYHVPETDCPTYGMKNLVLQGWTKPPKTIASFELHDKCGHIHSMVDTYFGKTEIRLNINDIAVPSGELELVYENLVCRNLTDLKNTFRLLLYFDHCKTPLQNDTLSSSIIAQWVEDHGLVDELEHIIESSFKNQMRIDRSFWSLCSFENVTGADRRDLYHDVWDVLEPFLK